ncbi:proline-rich protein 36-like isoform X2 [Denticeps clupeoides]|uniref:proline-rich protein 36-like isoform X2 n=1 Tax=Denticeps clupeoides TaxID=299321 RepID=UPI0010A56D1D|nr:proline-rich protein 36-like isoform X2 [Denticeps clupeoides]
MTLRFHGPASLELPFLINQGSLKPLQLSQLPSGCGYSFRRNWMNMAFTAPYDGCFVARNGDTFILSLNLWGLPLRMSCPNLPQKPPSLTCDPHGMTVKLEMVASTKNLTVKVNGEWEPLMKVASRCGFSVLEHLEAVEISAPYRPCIRPEDGLFNFAIAADHEVKLSCPSRSPGDYVDSLHVAPKPNITATYPPPAKHMEDPKPAIHDPKPIQHSILDQMGLPLFPLPQVPQNVYYPYFYPQNAKPPQLQSPETGSFSPSRLDAHPPAPPVSTLPLVPKLDSRVPPPSSDPVHPVQQPHYTLQSLWPWYAQALKPSKPAISEKPVYAAPQHVVPVTPPPAKPLSPHLPLPLSPEAIGPITPKPAQTPPVPFPELNLLPNQPASIVCPPTPCPPVCPPSYSSCCHIHCHQHYHHHNHFGLAVGGAAQFIQSSNTRNQTSFQQPLNVPPFVAQIQSPASTLLPVSKPPSQPPAPQSIQSRIQQQAPFHTYGIKGQIFPYDSSNFLYPAQPPPDTSHFQHSLVPPVRQDPVPWPSWHPHGYSLHPKGSSADSPEKLNFKIPQPSLLQETNHPYEKQPDSAPDLLSSVSHGAPQTFAKYWRNVLSLPYQHAGHPNAPKQLQPANSPQGYVENPFHFYNADEQK